MTGKKLKFEDWADGVPQEVDEQLSDENNEDWIGDVETKETVDATTSAQYDNLESPAVVQIPVVHCSDHSNPETDRRHLSGTIRAKTVRNLPWVLCDANPREPSHNKVVREIQDTVLNDPSEMQCRNGGLTVVASFDSYDSEESVLVLGLKSREGLVNGGHTQLAISTLDDSIDDSALVEFEVIVLENDLDEDQRVRIATNIAETRNYEQELEERSRADHRGFYNPFKERLEKDLISWHENDSEVRSKEDAIPSDHLVRLFTIVDPNKHQSYYAPMESGHGSPTTSKSGPHGNWFETVREIVEADAEYPAPRPFEHIYPMLPAVLELRDGIAASLHNTNLTSDFAGGIRIKSNQMWRTYIKNDPDDETPPTRLLYSKRYEDEQGVDISTTLESLLMGYLRGNVWLPDGKTGTVAGWFQDPIALWEENKVRKLDTINDAVDFGSHGGVTFSRNKLLFREEQLLGIGPRHGGDIPDPEIVYDDDTRARYFRVDGNSFNYDAPTLVTDEPSSYDANDATHYLTEGELVEITGSISAPQEAPLYRLDTDTFFISN